MNHVSTLAVLGTLGMLRVKREKFSKSHWKEDKIFNFSLEADIEHQYMHLDSTFNVLSNSTNYKFQFHR